MLPPVTRRERRAQIEEAEQERRSRSLRARSSRLVGELILWVAAIAGTVCIVLVILAFTMNITLIMFRTGSMAPAIPAGSVAVVRQVPASSVAVGDVVTVDREGQLPVTHRVTSIVAGQTESARVLTMRGDANADEDPFPYEVESVRTVLFSVPGIAPAIVKLGNPFVLGGITVGAALLVGWAFWPRESAQPAGKKSRRRAK